MITDRHVLVSLLGEHASGDLAALMSSFCGRVITSTGALEQLAISGDAEGTLYLCGDIGELVKQKPEIKNHPRVWACKGVLTTTTKMVSR